MAKILTTKGSAAALEDIIRRAEKEIYLISFSFIISDSFLNTIKNACKRDVQVHLVYGKTINQEALNQLRGLKNLKIYFLKNLHAKIFANEFKCIIGSMNFSEYSEANNTELGVLLSLANDAIAFNDTISHCMEIVNDALYDGDHTSNITNQSNVIDYKLKVKKAPIEMPRNNSIYEKSNDSTNSKDFSSKLQDLNRYQFAKTVLEKQYGNLINETGYDDTMYIFLPQFRMSVYINEERIDFIYKDNFKYKSKRFAMEGELIDKLDRTWFNPNRINVTANSLRDIEMAINIVMAYTVNNLI